MSEWKEVWYAWVGEGIPCHTGKITKVNHRDGLIVNTYDFPEVNQMDVYLWSHMGLELDIVAYTLGEMRRRVVCSECSGHGEIACVIVCRACHGTGKVWEYAK